MKVAKSSAYHTSSSASKHQPQPINQPILSSSNGLGQQTNKEKGGKPQKTGGGKSQSSQPQQTSLASFVQGHAIEQTPSGKNYTKIVNLSFAGQDFQHRNMSMSMHNGFYVNGAVIQEEAFRKHHQINQQQQTLHQAQKQVPAGPHFQSGQGPSQMSSVQHSQQLGANTGSVRSLGMGQRQQQTHPQMQQSQQSNSNQGVVSPSPSNSFTTVQQTAFNNLHLQNTPQVKKNGSSKNQQRRKISAINQSAQFSTGNQLLQSTVQYPNTIKKMSSKANMLLESQGAGQVFVSPFSGTVPVHQSSVSVPRVQNSKLHQTTYKARFSELGIEDCCPSDSINVFMQENRIANLNQAQQKSVKGQTSTLQSGESFFTAQQEGPSQQQFSGMQSYIPSKQIGVNTPTNFKQVGLANYSGQDNQNENGQKMMQSQGVGGNLGAKNMAQQVGSHHQITQPNQQQRMLTQQSSKLNSQKFVKVAQQQDLVQYPYAKSQQHSNQSLQVQQLQLLSQQVPQLAQNQLGQVIPVQVQGSPGQSQQTFVYGRKLAPVKNGSETEQRTASTQPQFEMELLGQTDQQFNVQKTNSMGYQAAKLSLVLNQAQIQYAIRESFLGTEMLPHYSQQPAQKNTNLIVRIDNSSAGNHQITKRKRLKENGTIRSGQLGQEPSESDQISEASQQQQQAMISVENMELLPIFQTSSEQSDRVIKDMANSQQNFNSRILQGQNIGGNTADEESKLTNCRNEDTMLRVKPGSALIDKRARSLQSGRPDSKQGIIQVTQVRMISDKKKFNQELAARDALIGIDDEDELVAHEQDFSENEGDSQMSAQDGEVSNNEMEIPQFNKSVDSDKLGKSGSISYRQTVHTKQVVSQLGQQMAAGSGQPPVVQPNDSDIESEKSGQSSMFVRPSQLGAGNGSSLNVLASDSEDGNFSDGSYFQRGATMREDGVLNDVRADIDGISEHSSDEVDSESELDETKKEEKEEKPIKKKKKKNKDVAIDKKTKGEKETIKSKKESSQAAPAKKNFTETKEKEFNATKQKKKDAPKNKQKTGKENQVVEKTKGAKSQKIAPEQTTKSKKQRNEESNSAAVDPTKESPKKKKKQKLNLALVNVQPTNIEEQQLAFFESGCATNPILKYENLEATQKFLAQFKEPSDEYLQLSIKILDSFITTYNSESLYMDTEGEVVSKEETTEMFMEYLTELGFEDLLTVQYKQNQVVPTSVTHDPKTGKSRVNIRDPPDYRRGRLIGVIDHEIGTHFIRKFNERFQVWHKKRDKFEMKSCIQTEEGFACVNQLVRMALEGKHPFLYRSALNYYAAYMASKLSFVELFNDIGKYIDGNLARWRFVLRLKRGMTDTSEPGGLYKDQCYLEGAVTFLQNRHTIDIIGLFTGKISFEDLQKPKIQKVLNKESIKLPPFMKDMDQYMKALDIIARTNLIPSKSAE